MKLELSEEEKEILTNILNSEVGSMSWLMYQCGPENGRADRLEVTKKLLKKIRELHS